MVGDVSKSVHRNSAEGDDRFFKQFARQLFVGPYYKMRKYTLLVFCGFGLGSVCIDLDHFIIEQTGVLRPLHLPCFIFVWVVCICYYAYFYRRFHKNSIKKKGDTNETK